MKHELAMSPRVILQGCITALITPFRDGRVDFDALARLVDWQIDAGVDGLVAVGTTGESATLTMDEHVEVIAAVVRVAAGRVPVIAGAGGNATAEALELTRRSEAAGANALLHVTPYYNKPTQEGLFRHFETIAQATTLPVILYNVPSRTACDLLPDTAVRLAALDSIVAIKEATGNLVRATELIARLPDRMAVLSGDDSTCFPLYAIGARGVISVVSNVCPADMAQMWDAVRAGDWDRARTLHYKLRLLNELLFRETSPAPVKAALALMGRCTNELRLPLVSASATTVDLLRSHMKSLAML